MQVKTVMRRRERQIRLALEALSEGMTYRDEQATFHLRKSTVWERNGKENQSGQRSKRYVPTEGEEQLIMDLILRFADGRSSRRRLRVREAAKVIGQFVDERKQTLPFHDNIPGKRWPRSFYGRQKNFLQLGYPSVQERKRFAATNAEVLTSHFSALEVLMSMYQFDEQRV